MSDKGILQGIRVIDAGAFIAGTGASAMLGSMGAEVIKIEDPVRGDSYRGMAQQYGDSMSVGGRHIGFETANINKKGITLNLTTENGREILHKLVAKSDVFHTNYPKAIIDKLGLTYDALKQHNDKLIYCSTSGFGLRGPRAGHRSYDTLAQAQSGFMWTLGDRRFDEPVAAVGAPIDQLTTMVMAFGMVSAICARERLGIGQEVHVSLLGSAINMMSLAVNVGLLRGRSYGRFNRETCANPMSNNYKCGDNKWIMLAEPMSDRFWAEFCQVMGLQDIQNDPRFAVHLGGRSKHARELIKILDETFAKKPRDEWIAAFQARQVGFGYAPIYTVDESIRSPQAIENGYVTDFDHAVLGQIKLAGFPIEFSQTPAHYHIPAPEHGQHTEEVLSEVLGYSWPEMEELRNQGVI